MNSVNRVSTANTHHNPEYVKFLQSHPGHFWVHKFVQSHPGHFLSVNPAPISSSQPLFWGRIVFLAIPITSDCSWMVSIHAIAMLLGWPEPNNVNNQSSRSCSVWDRMAIQCMYPSFFFFFFLFLSFFHFSVLVVMARLARKGWCMGKEGKIINNWRTYHCRIDGKYKQKQKYWFVLNNKLPTSLC